MKFDTRDSNGVPNGFLVPIWNALEDPELRPEQVYMTAVAPWARKGPHLHMKRRGCFVCLRGDVRIVSVVDGARRVEYTGESHDFRRVIVPAGVPAAIYNEGPDVALVLNLPSPAWSLEDSDEHFVSDEGW